MAKMSQTILSGYFIFEPEKNVTDLVYIVILKISNSIVYM